MSLFENEEYQWRETYFVLFPDDKHPLAKDVVSALQRLDPRYQIRDVIADESGKLESLTLEAPDDYAAMDVSLVRGEEVVEQTEAIKADLVKAAATPDEKAQLRGLERLRCRFDIYHFEQIVFVGRSDEDEPGDEFLDPGSVLTVMQKIAQLCDGVVIDPQTNTMI